MLVGTRSFAGRIGCEIKVDKIQVHVALHAANPLSFLNPFTSAVPNT
jgi:hypothetical protein